MLKQVCEGQTIYFSHQGERYYGVVAEIIPKTNTWKYVIEEPRSMQDNGITPSLWLYDGDEEEWEISFYP